MLPGTSVILIEKFADLHQGQQGVTVKTTIGYPWTGKGGYEKPVIGVQFDGLKNPAIGREINGKYEFVIDHCKKITKKLLASVPVIIESAPIIKIVRDGPEVYFIKLHIWIKNKKAVDSISETVWGDLAKAKTEAQKIWKTYPSEAKKIYIYDSGVFFKTPVLVADNFKNFEV